MASISNLALSGALDNFSKSIRPPHSLYIHVTLQHTTVIYGADSQRKCGIPLLVIKGGLSQKEKRLRLNDD